jgi:phosphoribosylglycinamide formyltransferase-1
MVGVAVGRGRGSVPDAGSASPSGGCPSALGCRLAPILHYRFVVHCAPGRSPSLGVLASGTGTILQAIIDAPLPVALVVVDRACAAVELARAAGVPVEIVTRDSFGNDFDRAGYTDQVVAALEGHSVEVVAMAGFGTVLAAPIFERYAGRVLNTHPALLPSFKGWHAVADALAYGVKLTGCTVHVATETVDEGPILAQEAVPVLDDDTEERLHERIKAVERRLYPETIRAFLQRQELQGVPL